MWQSLLELLKSNNFLQGGLVLGLIGGIVVYLKSWPIKLYYFLKNKLILNAYVESTDPCFQWIYVWICNQPKIQKTKNIWLTSYRSLTTGIWSESNFNNADDMIIVPGQGTHFFRYKHRLFWISMNKEDVKVGDQGFTLGSKSKLTIKSLFGNRELIQALAQEGKKYIATMKQVQQNNIQIWINNGNSSYSSINPKPKRKSKSLILENNLYNRLFNDIQNYLHDQAIYLNRGIPWKRGYLLHGPPGNGKSSLIFTLASELNKDLYIINLKSVCNDADLLGLFNRSAGDIIVIEDIDCILDKRSITGNEKFGVTFSGLLNAIDGITSSEGSILFMTTNHKDKLDSALIRPGRVDQTYYLGNASRKQIFEMYRKFYPEYGIHKAKAFASQFTDGERNMAQIQEILLNGPDFAAVQAAANDTKDLINMAHEVEQEIAKQ